MAINATVDGVTYRGITQISLGGKTIRLSLDSGVGVWSVNLNLTNITSSNKDTYVEKGDSFSTRLTAAKGFDVGNVTVIMGDQDITATAYSNGVVSIAQVTGNITITASAVEGGVIYTLPEPIVATTQAATTAKDTAEILFPEDVDRTVVLTLRETGSYTSTTQAGIQHFFCAPRGYANSSNTFGVIRFGSYSLGEARELRVRFRTSTGTNNDKMLGSYTPDSADDVIRIVVTYSAETRTFKARMSIQKGSAAATMLSAVTYQISESFVAQSVAATVGGDRLGTTYAALENATIEECKIFSYAFDDDDIAAYLTP